MRAKLTALGFLVAAIVTFNSSPVYAQGGATPPYGAGYFQVLNDNTTYPCGVGSPGVTVTDQITGALNQTVFGGGGASDWTCYGQPITITKDVFSPISANILVWGGEHAITVNANATIPSNFEICFGPGGSIAAGVGFTLTNHATSCLGGGGGGGSCPGTATPTQILYDDGGNCAGIPTSEVDVPDTLVEWQYYFFFGQPLAGFDPSFAMFFNEGDNYVADLNGANGIGLDVFQQSSISSIGEWIQTLLTGEEGQSLGLNVLAGTSGPAGAQGALIDAALFGTATAGLVGLEVDVTNYGTGAATTATLIQTGDAPASGSYDTSINFLGGTGLYEFGDWTEPGTDVYANLVTQAAELPGGGFTKNCSDCDTPAYAGAVCTASGDHLGAQAIYIQSTLTCYGKVTGGGGGGAPGAPDNSVQYRINSTTFGGIPGSVVDGTNGLIALAPTGTGVALTVTGASGSDVADFTQMGNGAGLTVTATNTASQVNSASFNSTLIDSAGSETGAVGITTGAGLTGTNFSDDGVISLDVFTFTNNLGGGPSGTPSSIEGILIEFPELAVGTSAPLTTTGVEIQDQNAVGIVASMLNAAIVIDDQTLTGLPEPYAIKGGTGWYFFGDFVSPGTDTLASLGSQIIASPTSGTWQKGCSDCDTPTVEGAVCTAAGDHAGALAIFLRGTFLCF